MKFHKYMHIERFGTDEVEGIELGKVYVFPKLDGTNASVWMSDLNFLSAGSRRRHLSNLDNDNHGFLRDYVTGNAKLLSFFDKFPQYRLFGEWLVPHSLKTYQKDTWRKFYVFDVTIDKEEGLEYIPYDNYQLLLEQYGIDYIPCISIIKNGNYEQFINHLTQNVFLIKDGEGEGEGIVLKNYDYYNKYGRQTWAKLVTNEFKEKHSKEMGPSVKDGTKMIEEDIVEYYCTSSLIDKTYAKIISEVGSWNSKYIPRLLDTVFHELITEESWNIIKKFKRPTINYRTLSVLVINRIKEVKKDLF